MTVLFIFPSIECHKLQHFIKHIPKQNPNETVLSAKSYFFLCGRLKRNLMKLDFIQRNEDGSELLKCSETVQFCN